MLCDASSTKCNSVLCGHFNLRKKFQGTLLPTSFDLQARCVNNTSIFTSYIYDKLTFFLTLALV